MSIGNCLESLSQAILVGIILVGRLGIRGVGVGFRTAWPGSCCLASFGQPQRWACAAARRTAKLITVAEVSGKEDMQLVFETSRVLGGPQVPWKKDLSGLGF